MRDRECNKALGLFIVRSCRMMKSEISIGVVDHSICVPVPNVIKVVEIHERCTFFYYELFMI